MEIKLVLASPADFTLIAELAKEIWHKHYVPIIGTEQVEYMLAKIYNKESLLEQTEQKGHRFYLIEEEATNKKLGFISISSEDGKNFWIHKFYILNNEQAKGIGTKVFQETLKIMNHPESITLTVNRQNYKSINFYFKQGFTINEVADFDIGNNYFMNDFVMLWKKH